MQRAAVQVDVATIGRGMCDFDCALELGEELGSDARSGTVRAVDDDGLVIE